MDSEALKALAATLSLEDKYEANDIPAPDAADYEDFLWDEICEEAVEDVRQSPTLSSYFVVVESKDGKSEELYVSPDWPSAEQFARGRLHDSSGIR
jgi:hypothetical protein